MVVDQQLKVATRIKLNEGGIKFTMTLSTLVADPDSMLAVMFSGRFSLQKDEEGAIFIDQNDKYFDYVLNFL